MNQEQFINARATQCPGCGKERVAKNGELTDEGGVLHQADKCLACGGTWVTQFIVSGFSMFKKGKVKK